MRGHVYAAALALAALLTGTSNADSGSVPLERISLGESGGWIALQVRVGDQTGRWLIDTGSSRNLISPALARRLGLKPAGTVSADTPLGSVQGGEAALPAVRVGSDERLGQHALVIDPAILLGAAADGIEGVLGVPWLEGRAIELDLRRWTARADDADASECPQGLQSVGLTRHRSLPVVALGSGERYVLDTGNPAGLIRIETDLPDASTPGIALPGGMRLTLLQEAALGPQVRHGVPVTRLAAPTLRRALGSAARGLAGVTLLDGAVWVIDLARQQLCAEAGRFDTPGGFGLVPERAGDSLRVKFVLAGSPAERAGIRVGEPILQWAGLPATSRLQELWDAVQGLDELQLRVGEAPTRDLSLRRALFAPLAP